MPQFTWLITGCTAGLGEALAYSVLARGDRVIATGRNATERLTNLRYAGAALLDLDVALPEIIEKRVHDAIAIYGHIDILVNNAGYSETGWIEGMSYELWLKQFNTNFFGSVGVTTAILPHFRQRKSGTIVFVGSFMGWVATPLAAPYGASKFALEGFVESLRGETEPFGVKATIFEPGFFRTNFLGSGNAPLPSGLADYAETNAVMTQYIHAINGNQRGDVKKIAELMIDVVKQEGAAAGRELPNRLPIGPDAFSHIKKKCTETLKLLEDWEELILSTDLPSDKERDPFSPF